jgi:hypothetical protein
MLNVVTSPIMLCRYAECCYAECHCAECRGAYFAMAVSYAHKMFLKGAQLW